MNSTRLPGKVLVDLGGKSALARVVQRLGRSQLIDQVVVATTEAKADDAIVRECRHLGVDTFRGSEIDVLDRYFQTAKRHAAEAIVRITADCPLVDAEVVDETVGLFRDQTADYASNLFPRIYPRGLDTEVFTYTALEHAWQSTSKPYEREHVTPYFYQHPEIFRLVSASGKHDYSHFRWTLDTPEDLDLIAAIYSRLADRDDFGWREVLDVMMLEPELADLNLHVRQENPV